LDAALQSGQFMLDVLDLMQPGNGLSSINSSLGSSCDQPIFKGHIESHNSAGIFLEGLAYLPVETSIGSSKVADL
jgi:hypothetical protein